MTRKLEIRPEGKRFVCDEPASPGTPYVGRGNTKMEAFGDWFWQHSNQLGFECDWNAPEPVRPDPVKLFHIGRGCCDGTDPAACHRQRVDAEEAARQRAKLQAIADRAPGPHEYEGTDETYICHHNWHHVAHQMGDTCPRCGFVA